MGTYLERATAQGKPLLSLLMSSNLHRWKSPPFLCRNRRWQQLRGKMDARLSGSRRNHNRSGEGAIWGSAPCAQRLFATLTSTVLTVSSVRVELRSSFLAARIATAAKRKRFSIL